MTRIVKIIFGLCVLIGQTSLGQIINPVFSSREVPYCDIVKIERTSYNTTVYFKYTNPYEAYGSWACAGESFFIRDTYSKTKYKLVKANNIPICPTHHNFQRKNQTLEFNIVFEAIPPSITKIDIIEDEIKGGFNFYGVSLTSSNNTIDEPKTFKSEAKTLKSEAKMRELDNPGANIVFIVPIGTQVKTLELTGGYYKVEYKGKIGYINEVYFEHSNIINNTSTSSNTSNSSNSSNSSSSSSSSSYSSYSYPKKWDEYNLKEHWKINGAEEIEGIYIDNRDVLNCNGFGNCKDDSYTVKQKFYIIKQNNEYTIGTLTGGYNEKLVKMTGYQKYFLNITPNDFYFINLKDNDEITLSLYLNNSNELISEKVTFNEEHDYGAVSKITFKDKFSPIYKPEKKQEKEQRIEINPKSSGTGYAISSNGYIVTNHHVTNGASSIKVRGINGDFSKTYTAKVIIEDKNNDLSIIKIDDSNFTNLGTIPYVIASRASDVGSSVFVLGYPLRATMGDEVKLTNGIISSKSGFQGDVTSYQITAPVQPGNSGGPLFDVKGNIIGIINAKHVGAENASYAIKASYLMNLIDLMPTTPKLQTISTVAGKPLTEQVKILKKFTYIIEINQ